MHFYGKSIRIKDPYFIEFFKVTVPKLRPCNFWVSFGSSHVPHRYMHELNHVIYGGRNKGILIFTASTQNL